ncbi:glutamate--tRNA ligase [Jatrophihabitans telluris]|uniref:Glutamate--tRNA ligase n=1 Tax=Jatrophihabitans telluris TaxID=2038343 RepID=A0ABY4R432_9ACTN|nr:glutamate--tRNA ligase [Jatrophihabitans telluris]UQX89952.1 glutamate--tRNA ligase [Jatrophihabitans telluris]
MSAQPAAEAAVDRPVRVRFCPSPTGNPHVGMARTALFNWAYARHTGGTFVFRIEDTDAARDSEQSYVQLVDSLHWLGMSWDEGPGIGGPHAPYRQSERRDIYAEVVAKLQQGGHLYEDFSTPEEVEARHRAAGRDPKLGYDNFDRTLSDEQRAAMRAEGREPVLRLRMPEHDLTWTDLVRGEVSFAKGTVPDFVVVRKNGDFLYTLVNPVDDALMRITHVLRGEDLLPSTPRQIALYEALIDVGVTDFIPEFGHLPYVMGEGNKKLSKRDPESNLLGYRESGYVPEGLVNYLALLGWAIADDHDVFSPAELVAAFDIRNVKANPARFDPKKCEVINATHIRQLGTEDFQQRLLDFLSAKGVIADDPTPRQRELVAGAAPLVQERIQTLGEAVDMLAFLFVSEEGFVREEKAVAKNLGDAGRAVLNASLPVLQALPEWTTPAIEAALRAELLDRLELKPRLAFGPLRVAITGRQVSPPLFESMELLGQDVSVSRIASALALAGAGSTSGEDSG